MNNKVDTTEQVRIFVEYERERYEAFVCFVRWFLDEVKRRVAPMGTTGARTKEVASFAEKILRKPAYDDPVHQFADLCGGRLIVHTRREVAAADELIGRCLKIVAREDKIELSGVDQFGYGSVHLDVAIGDDLEKRLEKAGIAMPPEIKSAVKRVREPRHNNEPIERKAEIQVRTDLQHVWADTLHDLIYKSGIDTPKPLRREANRLSAVLEEASATIDSLVSRLDAYKVDHGAFLGPKQMQDEKDRLEALLKLKLSDKALCFIALRLTKLFRSQRKWNEVAAMEPWIKKCGKDIPDVRDELRFSVAEALCRHNEKKTAGKAFRRGFKELEALAQPVVVPQAIKNTDKRLMEISTALHGLPNTGSGSTLRAKAMAELARAVFVAKPDSHYGEDARDLYFQAHLLEPENPYVYARYLHSHAVATGNKAFAVFMRTGTDRMIDMCREHIRVGIELPFAHFAQGMLHALLGDIDSCLLCCTRGIAASNDDHQIEEEIDLFCELRDSLARNDETYAEKIEMILQTLALGVISRTENPKTSDRCAKEFLKHIDNKIPALPVIIIDHALEHFSGTIYCGGTNAGISKMTGQAVESSRKQGAAISLKAYRPQTLCEDFSEKHPAYEQIQMKNTAGFTCLQVVQYWSDLLLNGVKPEKVRMLGIGGGKISLFEYHLAVALGATVGIIEGSGRSGADIVGNETWWSKAKKGMCFTLPNDRETVWNFLNVIPYDLGLNENARKRFEPAARALHAKYVENALKSIENKNLRPWDDLPADLKTSSLHQAMHLDRLLFRYGLEIKALKSTSKKPVVDMEKELGAEVINALAEMEHGRWNVERLFQGWRFGKVKNIDERTSPYLKPWESVPPDIQEYDKNPFRELPELIKQAGLGIYKAKKARS